MVNWIVFVGAIGMQILSLWLLIQRTRLSPLSDSWSRVSVQCLSDAAAIAGYAFFLFAHCSVSTARRGTYAMSFFVVGLNLYWSLSGSASNNLTRELLLMLCVTAVAGGFFGLVALVWAASKLRICIRTISARCAVFLLLGAASVCGPVITLTVMSLDDGRIYESVLGGHFDVCAQAGRESQPPMPWIDLAPRRLLNFYTGSEQCRAASDPRYSHAELDLSELWVASHCSDGTRPRVLLADLARHAYGNLDNDAIKREDAAEVAVSAKAFRLKLEQFSKQQGLTSTHSLQFERDSLGAIKTVAVELKTTDLYPKRALENRTASEAALRFLRGVSQGSLYVVHVPWPSVSVYCGSEEELHLTFVAASSTQKTPNTAKPPPTNVLLVVIDAESRPRFVRDLPQTTAWLRDESRASSASHWFEMRGLTTTGHSTAMNLPPMLCGVPRVNGDHDLPEIGKNSIFSLLKLKHGSSAFNSIVCGGCLNTLRVYLGAFQHQSFDKTIADGFGSPSGPVDDDLFSPFCHSEYGPFFGNFQGPYSIVPRCIGKDYVHQHVFQYVESYQRQRRVSQHSTGFFQMAYLFEAHEGAHAVIHLVDEDLQRFLQRLKEVGAFNDTVVVLLSDHGNHMGPYFELTKAGKLERTMPFSVWSVPHGTAQRIAARRGVKMADWIRSVRENGRRMMTSYDVYATLVDLLELDDVADKNVMGRGYSMFATVPKRTNCRPDAESSCSLSFCS